MDYVNIVLNMVDIPMIIGIVVLIQALKKAIKINSKWWALVIVGVGFLASLIKTTPFEVRQFITTGLVYAAGIEFVYQSWRTIKDSLTKEKK